MTEENNCNLHSDCKIHLNECLRFYYTETSFNDNIGQTNSVPRTYDFDTNWRNIQVRSPKSLHRVHHQPYLFKTQFRLIRTTLTVLTVS